MLLALQEDASGTSKDSYDKIGSYFRVSLMPFLSFSFSSLELFIDVFRTLN